MQPLFRVGSGWSRNSSPLEADAVVKLAGRRHPVRPAARTDATRRSAESARLPAIPQERMKLGGPCRFPVTVEPHAARRLA